jgi:transcriptional regulator with XRE-family HTH domain
MALKDIREARELTQRVLSDRSGVNIQTISDIETGANKNPSWEKVAKLAHVLECDPQDIFPVELPPTNEPAAEATR